MFSTGNGICGLGSTAGSSFNTLGNQRATLFSGSSLVELVGPFGNYSNAMGLNSNGIVIGESSSASGATWATVWDVAHGTSTQIVPYSGLTSSTARGVNQAGQVVGYSNGATSRAFMYHGGITTDLGSNLVGSGAFGINSAGVVVGGGALNGDPVSHAVIWNSLLQPSYIPGLDPLETSSRCTSINDNGLVLGGINLPGGLQSVFVHDSISGQTWDPNNYILGGLPANTWFTAAGGINSFGDIEGTVVIGNRATGIRYAATLYVVPAPGSLTLLGLSGLLVARRRR